MTTADGRRPPSTAYPWHDAVPPVAVAADSRSAIQGAAPGWSRAPSPTSSTWSSSCCSSPVGYAAVAATRFLLGPTTFPFPAPSPRTLLLVGLCVQAVYFAVTWAVVGGTYGDRLLGLRVTDDRGARLGLGPVRRPGGRCARSSRSGWSGCW